MKLYEFPPTRSIRARWTLQEIGVPFESVNVDLTKGEHKKPEFLALNPAGKLPVLVDGDVVLTESVAIVLYLAEKHPEAGLVPRDLVERAHLYQWLLFAATELEQPLWRIARHTWIYPKERRLPADVELAREEFRQMAAVLDARMTGRQYVVGKTVTVADFVLAYTLDMSTVVRPRANEVHLLDGCPELQRYLAAMYARPKAALRIAEAFARVRSRAG